MAACQQTLQAGHLLSVQLRARAIGIALHKDFERPGNTDRDLLKYQLTGGNTMKQIEKHGGNLDYCVSFIYWCYEQARAGMKDECGHAVPSPFPFPCTQVSRLKSHALTHGKLLDDGELPQKGDIYMNDHHAAFIAKTPTSLSNVVTMEGNTYKTNKAGVTIYGILLREGKDLSTGTTFARY